MAPPLALQSYMVVARSIAEASPFDKAAAFAILDSVKDDYLISFSDICTEDMQEILEAIVDTDEYQAAIAKMALEFVIGQMERRASISG